MPAGFPLTVGRNMAVVSSGQGERPPARSGVQGRQRSHWLLWAPRLGPGRSQGHKTLGGHQRCPAAPPRRVPPNTAICSHQRALLLPAGLRVKPGGSARARKAPWGRLLRTVMLRRARGIFVPQGGSPRSGELHGEESPFGLNSDANGRRVALVSPLGTTMVTWQRAAARGSCSTAPL